jgi:hypothetical protein
MKEVETCPKLTDTMLRAMHGDEEVRKRVKKVLYLNKK